MVFNTRIKIKVWNTVINLFYLLGNVQVIETNENLSVLNLMNIKNVE